MFLLKYWFCIIFNPKKLRTAALSIITLIFSLFRKTDLVVSQSDRLKNVKNPPKNHLTDQPNQAGRSSKPASTGLRCFLQQASHKSIYKRTELFTSFTMFYWMSSLLIPLYCSAQPCLCLYMTFLKIFSENIFKDIFWNVYGENKLEICFQNPVHWKSSCHFLSWAVCL